MNSSSLPSISLPGEAKAVIWRIFGEGELPLKRRLTYNKLIERIVKAYAPPSTRIGPSPRSAGGSSLMGINNGSSLK